MLYESVFKTNQPDSYDSCPNGHICTDYATPVLSSICAMDIGDPLFTLKACLSAPC